MFFSSKGLDARLTDSERNVDPNRQSREYDTGSDALGYRRSAASPPRWYSKCGYESLRARQMDNVDRTERLGGAWVVLLWKCVCGSSNIDALRPSQTPRRNRLDRAHIHPGSGGPGSSLVLQRGFARLDDQDERCRSNLKRSHDSVLLCVV
jgi:hypothetical protein